MLFTPGPGLSTPQPARGFWPLLALGRVLAWTTSSSKSLLLLPLGFFKCY